MIVTLDLMFALYRPGKAFMWAAPIKYLDFTQNYPINNSYSIKNLPLSLHILTRSCIQTPQHEDYNPK